MNDILPGTTEPIAPPPQQTMPERRALTEQKQIPQPRPSAVVSVDKPTPDEQADGTSTARIARVVEQYYHYISVVEAKLQKHNHFVELDPDIIEAQRAFHPKLSREIFQRVQEQRIAVVSPFPQLPTTWLLREVALMLQQHLQQRSAQTNGRTPLTILEYVPSDVVNTPQTVQEFDLDRELEGLTKPAILLLPRVTREHLGWRLNYTSHAAQRHGHYVLAGTELSAQVWQIQPGEQACWIQVVLNARESLFQSSYLVDYFIQGLVENQSQLPPIVRNKTRPEDLLVEGQFVCNIALRLRTPYNIFSFLQMLSHSHKDITAQEVVALLAEATQPETKETIKQQYYRSLSRQEQLLAVGMSFFEGLEEHPLFAALQNLMGDVWQMPDSVPSAFDQIDLEHLLIFFNVVAMSPYSVRFESRVGGQRAVLFNAALKSYRRHIQRALPWLVDIVQQSVRSEEAQSPIYGIEGSHAQLRAALGETFSDLSLQAGPLVNPALLVLVSSVDEAMHVFVARVLSRWCLLGHTQSLVQLLDRWQRTPRSTEFVRFMLSRRSGETTNQNHEIAETVINSASLLIITYAIRYAQPDHIPQELIHMLMSLAKDQNWRVQYYLREYTLDMLIPLHINQMEPLLRQLVRDSNMRVSISTALASAYRSYSVEVAQLIRKWFDQGSYVAETGFSNRELSSDEALLMAVSLTLSKLPYETVSEIFGIDDARKRQRDILRAVNHPEARAAVWSAGFRLSGDDAQSLREMLAEVQDDEIDEIISILTQMYLEQRAKLPGPCDVWMKTDFGVFPIWLSHYPPETEVEQALRRAIDPSQDEHLQELAFLAFVSFTEHFNLREEAYINQRNQKPSDALAVLQSSDAALKQPTTKKHSPFYYETLIPLLVTIDDQPSRTLINNLWPLVRSLHQEKPEVVEYTLFRMGLNPESTLVLIAQYLNEALKLQKTDYLGMGPRRLLRAMFALWQEGALPRHLGIILVVAIVGVLLMLCLVILGVRAFVT
ncbi:MAG: hypothetical protein GFH27_549287n84 [Chloroflexi bacterium AL-W]|nr:hypothetical protein [Chloroflexi bacterium AL-N1]NOK66358.1 hypothetical protein [Chloroflexi bacterium AL-N10]NOK71746.1 hypothetical protein [Chloroflexi bacterium AL-N5]NOK81003.1 hypothetical protein [Chloroflexi bacterium AL-W]NOK89276.1 hypothetical protein [Chloroflexi bacterium AL-N15]